MAVFDVLKSKTKSMRNQSSDLSQDFTDQRRLESEKRLNAEIKAVYTAIGRAAFESRPADREASIDAQLHSIIERKQKIEENRKWIGAIMGFIAPIRSWFDV